MITHNMKVDNNIKSRQCEAWKRRNKDDFNEFYTSYECVEEIVNKFDTQLWKNKIIYCPCDSEESNFVKFFKANKEKLNYKELIYTSDDYHEHSDIFERCDIIITNPPFSHIVEWFVSFIEQFNKINIFITTQVKTYIITQNFDCKYYFERLKNNYFSRPDGKVFLVNGVCLASTIDLKVKREERPHPKLKDVTLEYYDDMPGVPNFDRVKDIPEDYIGLLGCPVSIFVSKDKIFERLKFIERYYTPFCNKKGKFIRIIFYKFM